MSPKWGRKNFKKCSILSNREVGPERFIAFSSRTVTGDFVRNGFIGVIVVDPIAMRFIDLFW